MAKNLFYIKRVSLFKFEKWTLDMKTGPHYEIYVPFVKTHVGHPNPRYFLVVHLKRSRFIFWKLRFVSFTESRWSSISMYISQRFYIRTRHLPFCFLSQTTSAWAPAGWRGGVCLRGVRMIKWTCHKLAAALFRFPPGRLLSWGGIIPNTLQSGRWNAPRPCSFLLKVHPKWSWQLFLPSVHEPLLFPSWLNSSRIPQGKESVRTRTDQTASPWVTDCDVYPGDRAVPMLQDSWEGERAAGRHCWEAALSVCFLLSPSPSASISVSVSSLPLLPNSPPIAPPPEISGGAGEGG